LYDIRGRILQQGILKFYQAENYFVNISDYQDGMYLVVIRNNSYTITEKLIKKK